MNTQQTEFFKAPATDPDPFDRSCPHHPGIRYPRFTLDNRPGRCPLCSGLATEDEAKPLVPASPAIPTGEEIAAAYVEEAASRRQSRHLWCQQTERIRHHAHGREPNPAEERILARLNARHLAAFAAIDSETGDRLLDVLDGNLITAHFGPRQCGNPRCTVEPASGHRYCPLCRCQAAGCQRRRETGRPTCRECRTQQEALYARSDDPEQGVWPCWTEPIFPAFAWPRTAWGWAALLASAAGVLAMIWGGYVAVVILSVVFGGLK